MYEIRESIKIGGEWFYPYVKYRGDEVDDSRKLADAFALTVDVTDDMRSNAPVEIIEMYDESLWEYLYIVDGVVVAEGKVPWEFVGWEPALRYVCEQLFDWYY